MVIWFTGLPSSGKSTLAEKVADRLRSGGRTCVVLDGDAVRAALVPAPGYTPQARDAFYATLARLAALISAQGVVVLVPATAHLKRYREEARTLVPAWVEVYVRTDLEECRRRDAKKLYAAAQSANASGMPGVDVEYQIPEAPDVLAEGGHDAAAVEAIVRRVELHAPARGG